MKHIRKLLAALLVAALCLSALPALAGGTVRTTGNVNLRKGPGLDYKTIRSIGEGVKLEYDKTDKDDRGVKWYRVSYKGNTGWVSSKYAKEGGSSGGGSDNKIRTTGNVNLRSGPGLDYQSLRTIGEGVSLTFDVTQKDDRGVAWYRVTYKGKTGWVSSKYAKKGGSSGGGSGGSGHKIRTTGNVNLRSGPGLDYKSLDSIDSGVSMSYDETKKDDRGVVWYHVSFGGKTGWVSSKYAKKQ